MHARRRRAVPQPVFPSSRRTNTCTPAANTTSTSSPDRDVAWRYGRLYRTLRERGTPIGANDLWIAATSLAHGMPLVTRNTVEFGRVPELRVVGY